MFYSKIASSGRVKVHSGMVTPELRQAANITDVVAHARLVPIVVLHRPARQPLDVVERFEDRA
jgi:hypothetical protein